MKKITQKFLEELYLADIHVYNLSLLDLLDLFYEWLGRQKWSKGDRIAWLIEECKS